jgi:hypothetical protein
MTMGEDRHLYGPNGGPGNNRRTPQPLGEAGATQRAAGGPLEPPPKAPRPGQAIRDAYGITPQVEADNRAGRPANVPVGTEGLTTAGAIVDAAQGLEQRRHQEDDTPDTRPVTDGHGRPVLRRSPDGAPIYGAAPDDDDIPAGTSVTLAVDRLPEHEGPPAGAVEIRNGVLAAKGADGRADYGGPEWVRLDSLDRNIIFAALGDYFSKLRRKRKPGQELMPADAIMDRLCRIKGEDGESSLLRRVSATYDIPDHVQRAKVSRQLGLELAQQDDKPAKGSSGESGSEGAA